MKQLCSFLLILTTVFTMNSFGQTSFSVSDTIIELNKTTDHDPIHWYVELTNNTGQDLSMVWEAELIRFPAEWNQLISDPSSSNVDIRLTTTGNYTLSANPSTPEMIISSMSPQNKTGNAALSILTYPANNIADSVRIKFSYQISQGSNGIVTTQEKLGISIDTENKVVHFEKDVDKIMLFSINGKKLSTYEKTTRVNYSRLNKGIYILYINYNNDWHSYKFIAN